MSRTIKSVWALAACEEKKRKKIRISCPATSGMCGLTKFVTHVSAPLEVCDESSPFCPILSLMGIHLCTYVRIHTSEIRNFPSQKYNLISPDEGFSFLCTHMIRRAMPQFFNSQLN